MWRVGAVAGAASDQMPVSVVAAAAAAAAAADQVPMSTIVAGLIALVSAVAAAWFGSRGTLRTADVQREANFDKRQDERNAYLESRNQELEAEVTRYREQYVGLRLEILNAGLNPDDLAKGVRSPSGLTYRHLYEQLRTEVEAAGLNPDELGGFGREGGRDEAQRG